MKKFGYRFALIAGVTSLLVSALIAPVSLAKLSGKNVPSSTQTKQTKPSQKIAILPVVVGGVVLGADTVIKITAIYIGLCGLKTPSDCGKNATKAINEINAYLKQTGSKVTMTLKQAYDMALKYKTAFVAPPKPKTPGQNNIVPLAKKSVQSRKIITGKDDDNTACNRINDILKKFVNGKDAVSESLRNSLNGVLPESFQKTGQFPEYNIIVCISKKIPNKEELTTKIQKHLEKFKIEKNGFREIHNYH